MSSDQKVLAYFKRFEENFPSIVDLFKSRNVKQVISNLLDAELLPLSSDYDPRTINPFDELLADALQDPGGLYHQYLKNLETSLHRIIPYMQKKGLSFSNYKSMWNGNKIKEKQFWERYNELDVLHWIYEKGGLEGLEVDPNEMNSTKIDFKAIIEGYEVFSEIVSLSKKEYRRFHQLIENKISRVIKELFGSKCFVNIDFEYSFRKDYAEIEKIRNSVGKLGNRLSDNEALQLYADSYAKEFKRSLYNQNLSTFPNDPDINYIRRELKKAGSLTFPYPTATLKYHFHISISLIEDLIKTIPTPQQYQLIKDIKMKVDKKLNDQKKGVLKSFPNNRINVLIIFFSRYHDAMWNILGHPGPDESFFQDLEQEINSMLDAKISGFIIRTFDFDRITNQLQRFVRIYPNPKASCPIPKNILDALSS